MDVKEVEKIESLIKKAELEMVKSEAAIQTLKEQWKKKYGTDKKEELVEKLNDLNSELSKNKERVEVLYNKLLDSCDWDSLEEELA